MTTDASLAPGRQEAGLTGVLVGLLVFCLVSFTPQLLNDGDTYWHLAAGALMLDQGQVPKTDPFSYTYFGQPWTAHEWLAEILMSFAHRAGWNGLLLLFGAAAGLTAGLVAGYVRRWLSLLSTVVVLAMMAVCVAPSLLARPHILALAILAAWTVILIRARDRDTAPSLFAVALITLWANLHGSFVFGLALIGPFALEALISHRTAPWPVVRSWGLFGVAALLAAVITPHFIHGLIFPFQLMGMQANAFISEWAPTNLSKPEPFVLVLGAALFFALWKGLKVSPIRLLVLLGLLFMALQHGRHQAVLGVVAPLLLAQPLSSVLPMPARADAGRTVSRRWLAAGLGVLILAAVTLRLALPLTRGDGTSTPATAVAHVPANLRTRPVFNEYGYGGYLIHEGIRPFIDGRADMYGDGFIKVYEKPNLGDKAALDALLDQYRVEWTILQPDNPAVAVLDHQPEWRRLYADRYAVIHVLDVPAIARPSPASTGP